MLFDESATTNDPPPPPDSDYTPLPDLHRLRDYGHIQFVCENRSFETTKNVTKIEMWRLIVGLGHAFELTEAKLRQQFVTGAKRLLERIEQSYLKSFNEFARNKRFRYDPDCEKSQQLFTLTTFYATNIQKIYDLLCDQIYSNAHFGAYFVSLTLLMQLYEMCVTIVEKANSFEIVLDQMKPIYNVLDTFHNLCDPLLGCLNDTFEGNRAMAASLLASAIVGGHIPLSYSRFSELLNIANQLSETINPANCDKAKHLFLLTSSVAAVVKVSYREQWNFDSTLNTKEEWTFHHLHTLITKIERNIALTKASFLHGMSENPIFPGLTCVRGLLTDLDNTHLSIDHSRWKELFCRIVESAIEGCHVVSEVVCNLNPESIGHVPMDIEPVTIEALSSALKNAPDMSDTKLISITSQLLLISGWKAIKETSLIMGVLCEHFWWLGNEKCSPKYVPKLTLIDAALVKKMIEFFQFYLRNLRHRGAFEQAYHGFVQVTKKIWRSKELRLTLIESLKSLLTEFERGDQKDNNINENGDNKLKVRCLKSSVTRRSAGLPFIIQAILVSEHRHDSVQLQYVFESLLRIVKCSESKDYQQIHSLNILRALVREKALGEKVVPFMGQVIEIAIEYLSSLSFSLRNSANLLLDSAIMRVFGCSRLKNEIHDKNTITFDLFFTRYASLHNVFINCIKKSVEPSNACAVCSVILILLRLHPSSAPKEEFLPSRIVRPFLEPLRNITLKCRDLKLRRLAAKTLVRLEFYVIQETGQEPDLRDIDHTIDILARHSRHECRENLPTRTNRDGVISLIHNWIISPELDFSPRHDAIVSMFTQRLYQLTESLKENINGSKGTLQDFWLGNLFDTLTDAIILVRKELRPPQEPFPTIDEHKKSAFYSLSGIHLGIHFKRVLNSSSLHDSLRFKYLQLFFVSALDNLDVHLIKDALVLIDFSQSETVKNYSMNESNCRLLRQVYPLLMPASYQTKLINLLVDSFDMSMQVYNFTIFDRLKEAHSDRHVRKAIENFVQRSRIVDLQISPEPVQNRWSVKDHLSQWLFSCAQWYFTTVAEEKISILEKATEHKHKRHINCPTVVELSLYLAEFHFIGKTDHMYATNNWKYIELFLKHADLLFNTDAYYPAMLCVNNWIITLLSSNRNFTLQMQIEVSPDIESNPELRVIRLIKLLSRWAEHLRLMAEDDFVMAVSVATHGVLHTYHALFGAVRDRDRPINFCDQIFDQLEKTKGETWDAFFRDYCTATLLLIHNKKHTNRAIVELRDRIFTSEKTLGDRQRSAAIIREPTCADCFPDLCSCVDFNAPDNLNDKMSYETVATLFFGHADRVFDVESDRCFRIATKMFMYVLAKCGNIDEIDEDENTNERLFDKTELIDYNASLVIFDNVLLALEKLFERRKKQKILPNINSISVPSSFVFWANTIKYNDKPTSLLNSDRLLKAAHQLRDKLAANSLKNLLMRPDYARHEFSIYVHAKMVHFLHQNTLECPCDMQLIMQEIAQLGMTKNECRTFLINKLYSSIFVRSPSFTTGDCPKDCASNSAHT